MAEAAGTRRGARWLLLFCTLFGLAAMHTLGHGGVRLEGHHAHAAAMPEVGGMAAVAAVMPEADGAVAMAAVMPQAVVADCADCGGHRHEMSGWSVCVAVLGGLALALLIGAFLLGRTRELLQRFLAAAAGLRSPRAPPARRTGLRVASLAVLRI